MSRNTSKPLKGVLCMWRGLRPLDNGYDIILMGKLKQPIELHTHTHNTNINILKIRSECFLWFLIFWLGGVSENGHFIVWRFYFK